MGIGRTYVKSEDLAQEITQDTFLKFFDTVGRLNEEVVLKPWLRRIAVNTAIDYYRKNQKFRFHEEVEGHSLLQVNEDAVGQMSYEEILKLLHQLPEDQHLIFTLYEVEGYSHKEIAEKLNISVSTVENQMVKALKFLRTELKDYLPWIIIFFSDFFKTIPFGNDRNVSVHFSINLNILNYF